MPKRSRPGGFTRRVRRRTSYGARKRFKRSYKRSRYRSLRPYRRKYFKRKSIRRYKRRYSKKRIFNKLRRRGKLPYVLTQKHRPATKRWDSEKATHHYDVVFKRLIWNCTGKEVGIAQTEGALVGNQQRMPCIWDSFTCGSNGINTPGLTHVFPHGDTSTPYTDSELLTTELLCPWTGLPDMVSWTELNSHYKDAYRLPVQRLIMDRTMYDKYRVSKYTITINWMNSPMYGKGRLPTGYIGIYASNDWITERWCYKVNPDGTTNYEERQLALLDDDPFKESFTTKRRMSPAESLSRDIGYRQFQVTPDSSGNYPAGVSPGSWPSQPDLINTQYVQKGTLTWDTIKNNKHWTKFGKKKTTTISINSREPFEGTTDGRARVFQLPRIFIAFTPQKGVLDGQFQGVDSDNVMMTVQPGVDPNSYNVDGTIQQENTDTLIRAAVGRVTYKLHYVFKGMKDAVEQNESVKCLDNKFLFRMPGGADGVMTIGQRTGNTQGPTTEAQHDMDDLDDSDPMEAQILASQEYEKGFTDKLTTIPEDGILQKISIDEHDPDE